jgi:hypothetical protein
MMTRDDAAQEANNLGIAKRDLPIAREIVRRATLLLVDVDQAQLATGGMSDDINEFYDGLSNVLWRLQKAIEQVEESR